MKKHCTAVAAHTMIVTAMPIIRPVFGIFQRFPFVYVIDRALRCSTKSLPNWAYLANYYGRAYAGAEQLVAC
jgi:hypothetical protein